MLILTALTTIAMAVPNALGLFPGRGGARPSLIGSVNRRPTDPRLEEKVTAPIRTGDARRSATCDAPTAQKDRADRSSGRAHPDPVRARDCSQDHGQGKAGNTSKGGGRPDDPGTEADKKQKPLGDRGGGAGSQESGTTGVEHGNGGGAGGSGGAGSGSIGKMNVRPRTGNGSRSGHGNA
jgi:hypothetical protein